MCRWPLSVGVWSQYCRLYGPQGGVRQWPKFLAPLRAKHPTSVPLMMLLGHASAINREPRAALVEYFQVAARYNWHYGLFQAYP